MLCNMRCNSLYNHVLSIYVQHIKSELNIGLINILLKNKVPFVNVGTMILMLILH